jgi:class 3 adenylate cyclase
MIPEKVYENLQQGKPVLDNGKGVSVLYADICGFTAFSGKRHPQDIVRILSHLFSEFEKFTIECKCYKVHTIGDCYVALGVPDITNFDVKSTKNLIELALKMVNKLKEFKVTNALNMRIGIHTGCVTAGIVGTKIVRYDIYGSDVDIANLVETAGMPGRVNVSQNTKDLLDMNFEGEFEFEENKNVYHGPSDTTMMTYLLVDRKNKKR